MIQKRWYIEFIRPGCILQHGILMGYWRSLQLDIRITNDQYKGRDILFYSKASEYLVVPIDSK